MVSTTTDYADSRYLAFPGAGYDGVVRVIFGGYYATGALLYDGRAVLTAAHLFDRDAASSRVTFDTRSGVTSRSANEIVVHPGYDADGNNDLALVWLSDPAPLAAERFGLYRNADEIGQAFRFVGYGVPGTGAEGAADAAVLEPVRLTAVNRFDVDVATLKNALGLIMAWRPLAGTQLMADFDSGRPENDALGRLAGRADRGEGWEEGLISPGDSGGPAFIDGLIAGIASYTSSLSRGSVEPDVDDSANSSFGEVAAWQRVSAYQQWIDQSLRQRYPDAPSRPEDVRKQVAEGDAGTSYAYFLVQFNGQRADPDAILSVDYATRDGTALAGFDYVAVSGRLNIYPDEYQAVIPVEILGDATAEPEEFFYLDVFNPVGGGFGEGVVKLTAVREIVDDDGWMG